MQIDYKKYPLPYVRHHMSANNYLPVEQLSLIPEKYPPTFKEIDWTEVFLNKKSPNFLDIGCGKGTFLLNMSEQFPDTNILGIELRPALVEWINTFVKGENVPNAAAVRYSVANGIPFIDDESIENVFYLFPDPWSKRKQQFRRAFTTDFLAEVYRVLIPGGKLYLATDLNYIDLYHRKILDEFGKFSYHKPKADEWNFPTTNKENFCERKNIETYKLICEKIQ